MSKYWQEAVKISLRHLTKLECICHVSTSNCSEDYSIVQCWRMNMLQLQRALPLCGTSLKYLGCPGLQMRANRFFFKLLMKTCPNLQVLDIQLLDVTKGSLQFAANYLSNLIDLRIPLCNESLNDELVQVFEKTKRLKSLTMYCTNDITLTCLEKLPVKTLECLNITMGYSVPVRNIVHVRIKI